MSDGTCSVCGTVGQLRRSWCNKCWKRWRVHGDPLGRPVVPVPDLPGERWLPVVGYEGFYEVSDLGRVRSLRRNTATGLRGGGMLTPAFSDDVRLVVTLWREGRSRTRLVHRLVLEAFAPPCPPGETALHGPGGRLDNRLTNLSWGTPKKNNGPDKVRDGTINRGERRWNAILTEVIVIECRRRRAHGEGVSLLAHEFGVSRPAMSNAISGATWAHI